MQIRIHPDGTVHTIYQEELDLSSLGPYEVRRGSYVEPTPAANWKADLAPVDGPLLGPFIRRSEALQAEQTWLETFWLPAVVRI